MAKILQGGELRLPSTPLVQELVDACKSHGDRVFLKDTKTGEEATFRQFLDKATSVSSVLVELKQGVGSVVVLFSDTSIEAQTTLFGVWLAGATSAPLNPSLPLGEIRSFMKTCGSEVVYCSEECLEKTRQAAADLGWPVTIISPNGHGTGVIDFFSCLQRSGSLEGLEGRWAGKNHTIAIMFTSGTTGTPKGVMVTSETLKFTFLMKDFWTERSRLLLTTPLYWISNTIVTVVVASSGGQILIASRMPVEQILQSITAYKPTDCFTFPAILVDICQRDDLHRYNFSSFEALSVGGSVLLPEQRKEIVHKILGGKGHLRAMYGSTEASVVAFDAHQLELDSPKMAALGQVAKGVTVKIVDPETGKILPPHTVGEVCVRSSGIMKKYLNHPVTENDLDKEGFWHMGDIAYYDEDGYLYFYARSKDIMKYRGQQIAPAELESLLQRHPEVVESCVVAKTRLEQGGDLPAAFVVKKAGSPLTEDELYSFVSENVIDEKKLRGGIYFVDSLPKSPVGKLLRHELRKQLV